MTEAARDLKLAVLINVMCGHVAGVVGAEYKASMEERRAQLQALGFRGWRVQVRPAADEELVGLIAGERCSRCALDR